MRRNWMALIVALAGTIPCAGATLTVPGKANPWLAGMPDGTDTGYGDVAPAQSPVLVQGITLTSGGWTEISNVTGTTNVGGTWPFCSADGAIAPYDGFGPIASHLPGAQFSKSDILAPFSCLLGVFLNDSIPPGEAPELLDFSSSAARNYLTFSPQLNQTFFIGDGLTASGVQQRIIIPSGASRLFLGTLDGHGWYDNSGALTVDVSVVPEPATLLLVGLGAVITARRR